MAQGALLAEVYRYGLPVPVDGAKLTVSTEETGLRKEVPLGGNGKSKPIPLPSPLRSAGEAPKNGLRPYSPYTVEVEAPGFLPVRIEGVQVYAGITTVLPVHVSQAASVITDVPMSSGSHVFLRGPAEGEGGQVFAFIPAPAVLEPDIRLQPGPETYADMQRVFIPDTVTVHLGRPNERARDIRVSFLDYARNVACSEMFPTWPENALRANIHAQVGFILNRVFTGWYGAQGYPFDITNSTAFDQAFVEGRCLFDNVVRIVDEIFSVYPGRTGRQSPLFSFYCNGTTSRCGGLSQWGTVTLAQRGYTPLQMLQYYYGNNVELIQTRHVRGDMGS